MELGSEAIWILALWTTKFLPHNLFGPGSLAGLRTRHRHRKQKHKSLAPRQGNGKNGSDLTRLLRAPCPGVPATARLLAGKSMWRAHSRFLCREDALRQAAVAGGHYLVGREVMQQLPDVVRVLGVPVVAGPAHAVGPGLWPLQHQAALHGLQHLQGLGACQPQGPLHKLGVSIRNWRGSEGQDYTVALGVGSRATPLSPWKASPDPRRYEA